MVAIMNGGAIPETALYTVVAEPEGTMVGTLHEDFAVESLKGGATAHEFTIRIDVAKQPASKYETVLTLPPEAIRAGKGKGNAAVRGEQ